MPLVVFEPIISAVERPQTYALDRAAAGTGKYSVIEMCKLLAIREKPACVSTNRNHIRPTMLCNIALHNKRHRYLRNSCWCWCSGYPPVNVILLHNVFSAHQHFTSTKYSTRTRNYFILLYLTSIPGSWVIMYI